MEAVLFCLKNPSEANQHKKDFFPPIIIIYNLKNIIWTVDYIGGRTVLVFDQKDISKGRRKETCIFFSLFQIQYGKKNKEIFFIFFNSHIFTII